jgi:hypothetical protein
MPHTGLSVAMLDINGSYYLKRQFPWEGSQLKFLEKMQNASKPMAKIRKKKGSEIFILKILQCHISARSGWMTLGMFLQNFRVAPPLKEGEIITIYGPQLISSMFASRYLCPSPLPQPLSMILSSSGPPPSILSFKILVSNVETPL